ncbi:MAG: diguanylate cyclase [Comamonadaceae bacterium]|nr:MAG: diguanylate cyclase [Comamonadaceae bacterium]
MAGVLMVMCLMALWTPVASASAQPVLQPETPRVDMWPAVRILPDPSQIWRLEQVLAMGAQFEAPRTAHSTLGFHPEPVWIRMPFALASSAPPQWVLNIDYAPINRIEVYLVHGSQVVQQAVLGNLQQGSPRTARSHALMLQLQPGQSYELLLRVQVKSGMVMPISLSTPDVFLADALREQMFQGVMVSLMLCLVLYSLTMWQSLHDVVFFKYALVLLGGLMLSVVQFGVGYQFLWAGRLWPESHLGVLGALMSTVGFFLFFEHILVQPGEHRHFSRLMKSGAVLTVLVSLAYAFDGLSTHAASLMVGILGPMSSFLALPLTLRRVRQKDAMAIYLLLAVVVYFGASATMAGLVFGHIGVSFLTLHSVQLAGLLDALLLMRLLGLRTRATRQAVRQASQERDAMRSLAHSDPLTGLSNRRGLYDVLTDALTRCSPTQIVAVFVIDLDGFKPINDQYGHDVGDAFLVAVAARLQSLVRTNDTVARVGGDEFVLIVSGLSHEQQPVDLGQKILVAFKQPFQLAQHHCMIGLTIGYALAPMDGRDAKSLLKIADAGMYSGKSAGKHCLRRVQADEVFQETRF